MTWMVHALEYQPILSPPFLSFPAWLRVCDPVAERRHGVQAHRAPASQRPARRLRRKAFKKENLTYMERIETGF